MRRMIAAALLLVSTTGDYSAQHDSALAAELRRIVATTSGAVGVGVLHLESGRGASVNGDLRFPMMSVYKLPIVLHALRAVDGGRLNLAEVVTLGHADRRPGFSPFAEVIAKDGPLRLSMRELIAAIATTSDNTASDWLLRRVGGPAAVSQALRSLGIAGVDVSRYELQFAADYYGFCCVDRMRPFSLDRFLTEVDRIPPSVRAAAAKAYERDPRDSATPDGFTTLLARLQRGELLSAPHTAWLLSLMQQMHSRDTRIRAGLPAGTVVALRPGTSGTTDGVRAAHNDSGIVVLPEGRGHLVLSVFLKGVRGTDQERDATIARIAKVAYDWAMRDR